MLFRSKEAKPIVAKRPFVIFGTAGQLKAFKQLGYKTFDLVIDESYDDIEDKETRWHKALDSMSKLSLQDPLRVYERLKPILEHNKKHFESNFKNHFKNHFKNVLKLVFKMVLQWFPVFKMVLEWSHHSKNGF